MACEQSGMLPFEGFQGIVEGVLISACFLGIPCRWHGRPAKRRDALIERLKKKYILVPVCPEQLGGMPTPRTGEMLTGTGAQVLDEGLRIIAPENGRDVTSFYVNGARYTLEIARTVGARRAYLKAGSPSCDREGVTGGSSTVQALRSSVYRRKRSHKAAYERRTGLSDDVYDEKLKHFKENEKPEVVLLVGDDPVLTKIVLAWTNTAVRRAGKLTPFRGHSEDEAWQWLWKNAKYSMEELVSKSAQSRYGFEHKLAPLIGNRVLYPDGTVNSFVQRYLREKVLKLFDAKPRRGSKAK